MNSPLQSKVITISSLEERENMVVIMDQDNLRYSFFKTRQDGTQSVAYNGFLNGNHGGIHTVGTHTKIGHKEDHKTNQFGKPVTYRTIISFLGGVQPPAPSKNVDPSAHQKATEPFKERNFDQEGYERCCWTAYLEYVAREETANFLIDLEEGRFYQIFQAIKTDSERRFSKGWKRAEAMYGELPIINQEAPLLTDADFPPDAY